MNMRHRRLIAGSLLAGLMIATYSSAMAEPLSSDEAAFTTRAFNIVPEDIARVEEISGNGDAIVLRVGVGVCRGGPGGPFIMRVHGAPAAAFHIGEFIASGVLWVNDHPHSAVRTVTAEELRRIGCTFSPPPAVFTLTTAYFENAPESIYLVLRASQPHQHIEELFAQGSTCVGQRAQASPTWIVVDIDGLPPVRQSEPLMSYPSYHKGDSAKLRRLTDGEMRHYRLCDWSQASPPAVSDETFMTTAFAIVPENIARVTSISTRGDLTVLRVTVAACAGGTPGPLILRVHGAPPHVFHVGQLVATGASAPPAKRGIPAVRTVTEQELQRLGCPNNERI
jgi:hypothetical protein